MGASTSRDKKAATGSAENAEGSPILNETKADENKTDDTASINTAGDRTSRDDGRYRRPRDRSGSSTSAIGRNVGFSLDEDETSSYFAVPSKQQKILNIPLYTTEAGKTLEESLQSIHDDELEDALKQFQECIRLCNRRKLVYDSERNKARKKVEIMSPKLMHGLFLTFLGLQVLQLLVIDLIIRRRSYVTWTVMIVFQSLALLLVLLFSLKFLKQIARGNVSIWFLAQSFLNTVVTFAGIYQLVEEISPGSFTLVENNVYTAGDMLFRALQFFYFSTTVMTTVGFGDITPKKPLAMVFVLTQECLSVLYSTVIFAMGISHFTSKQQKEIDDEMKKQEQEKKKKQWRSATVSEKTPGWLDTWEF